MKTDDPKKVLEALLSEGGEALPFPAEAVARARALARGEADAPASEVESLPEPLALAVLEASVRARRPALGEALAGSPKKALAKAAKKALYQLRSVGVAVPEQKHAEPAPAPPTAAPATAEEMPCLLTPIAGTGERSMIVVRPIRGGGLEVHQLVMSDEHGVTEVASGDLNRSGYRKQLKAIRAAPRQPAIEIPLAEAREVLAEAAGANLRSKTPFPEGLDDLLRNLGVTPREELPALPPPQEGDAGLAVTANTLHEEPELQAWLPPESELRRLGLKMEEVATSPLQLSETQRVEQLTQAFRAAAEAFFTPELKRLYGLRLWKMADFFERTGRPRQAELARAEARRLYHDAPGLFSRFGDALFEKVLQLTRVAQAGHLPHAPEQPAAAPPAGAGPQEKKSPGGLILP